MRRRRRRRRRRKRGWRNDSETVSDCQHDVSKYIRFVTRTVTSRKVTACVYEEMELYNETAHDLCFSLKNIIKVNESRMRWAGNLACMGEKNKYLQGFDSKTRG
jgi:hypothetical protein